MANLTGRRASNVLAGVLLLAGVVPLTAGCVTVAEFRKLEARVVDLQRSQAPPPARAELADTAAEIDSLRGEVKQLSGELEVVDKRSNDALGEVRRLRQELASIQARSGEAVAAAPGDGPDEAGASEEGGPPSAEVVAYRQAYASWRGNDHEVCIEEFRSFLQAYPASSYADDSAFWMADCHYKQGDYKNAVLRFDDVVRNYPTGNRAPDALYRQGESLLKLGPSYHEAAKRAFQRVVKEYPDSARAAQARDQLKLIDAG